MCVRVQAALESKATNPNRPQSLKGSSFFVLQCHALAHALIARQTAPCLRALIAGQTLAQLRSQCRRQELRRTFKLQHRHLRTQLRRTLRMPQLRPQLWRTLRMPQLRPQLQRTLRLPQLRPQLWRTLRMSLHQHGECHGDASSCRVWVSQINCFR